MGLKLLPGDGAPLFDDHFDQLEERQAKQRSTALILGTPDPDETAEALRVGDELGIPPQAVQGAPDVFKGQAAQKRASTALQSAPKLQEWLGNPLNGALAKDDLDNLTWFEGWTPDTEFGKGLKTGAIGVKQVGVGAAAVVPQAARNRSMENLRGFEAVGGLSKDMSRHEVAELLGVDPQSTAASMAHGFLVAEPEQRQRMIDGMVSRVINSEETVQGIRDLISEFSADMQETQGRTVNFSDIDDVSAFGDWLSFNAGQSIPFLASLIAAGAAGGAPLAAGTGYVLGVGDINSGLIEEGVTDRPDLALAGGVPYAALEALGPAAAPFRRIGTDVLTEVAAGYFKRLGREVPKQAIEEFINEAGQEIIKDITVSQGTGEVVELNDETLLRWFNSGMAGAAGGLTFSPVTAAQSRVERDMERADAAGTTAKRLEQIDEMAAQSKVKERAPAKFQEALEAAGMQDQDLYVSAEGMREYFQAKDVELDDETLRAWGIEPADFNEKLASGGDVAVPASSYAAQISGTDDAIWLRDNAVFSPDEMSVAEAAAFNDQVRDILDEAIIEQQEAEATDRELRAADVQIYDEVFSQLRAAGRSPDVAQQEAGVWSAFWRTMGERYGEDPLALARSMGVSIRGPQTPEARRRRDQLDIMLGTLRQKGDKALAPRGQGVLDFIDGEGPNPELNALNEQLQERAIDLSLPNDEIAAALDAPKMVDPQDFVGRTFNIRVGNYSGSATVTGFDGGNVVFTLSDGRSSEISLADLNGGLVEFAGGGYPFEGLAVTSETSNLPLAEVTQKLIMIAREDGVLTKSALPDVHRSELEAAGYVADGDGVYRGAADDLYDEADRRIKADEWDEGISIYSPVHASDVEAKIKSLTSEKIVAALDADGQQYNQDGELLTDTPEFKAWFGDSKVVDGNGEPLVVYHSTMPANAIGGDVDFDQFRPLSHFGTSEAANDRIYESGMRTERGERVMPVYLSIENAIEIEDNAVPHEADSLAVELQDRVGFSDDVVAFIQSGADETVKLQRLSDALYDMGIDGLYYTNTYEDAGSISWVAVRPESVKSAFNRGTFDPNDARILYQDGQQSNQGFFARLFGRKEPVQSPEFKEWFGESKITDEDGKPLIVYHGSPRREALNKDDFSFKKEEIGSENDVGFFGSGFYFSTSDDTANLYADPSFSGKGGAVISAYLSIKNPLILNGNNRIFTEDTLIRLSEIGVDPSSNNSMMMGISEKAAASGFDGIVMREFLPASINEDLYEDNLADIYYLLGPDGFASKFSDMEFPPTVTQKAGGGVDILVPAENANFPDAAIPKSSDMDGENPRFYVEVIALEPTQIKSVHNRGTFDPNDPRILYQGQGGQAHGQKGGQGGQKRGSIALPSGSLSDGQTVINLFESADLSTFLHESGHFFLEAFNALASSDDAPAAMKADMDAMASFLGAESLDGLSVDQHEKWARGFEAYLMEGKAPSLALTSAFARFKAWLSRIYRTVAGLNVKLTPEIREVMDRMLATDAEIAEARADLNMRPLFTEAAPAGMSDADFATYQRMAQRGAEQAEQSLMKRTMDKVRRETQKWFKDERAAVRAEVEDRANRLPVYRLTEVLANQAWLTDTAEDVPDIQIDRDTLVEQYGDGVLGEISRTKLGGKRAIYARDGEHPDLVAEMFGFSNGPEMIEALQNAGKRKDYISGETDRIMNERHGDPLTDGSIEEAAALAVHSQQQAEVVITEARAIAKRLGMPTKDIKAKVYKARAQAMIGRMTVRQASRPEAFLQAERKAARAAERAFARVARGGRKNEEALAEAMQAKEQQILNQFLYREARDFSDKLQRGREKMRSYQKTSVRKAVGLSYVDEETGDLVAGHIEQIDALLDRFDFRQRSNKQIDNSEKLRAYVDRMVEEGRGDELSIDPKFLDESLRTHYTRLSVDDLQGLFDTIANIDHMGRRRAQLIDRQNKRNLDEVAVTLSDLIRKRYGKGKSEKQTGMVKNFFNLLLRVDTIAADIDGQEIGDFYTNFKKPLDQGAALEQKMNSQSGIDIAKIFEVYSAKEKRDLNTARVIDGGNGHPWTKQQILSVALNTGNRENRKRILDRKVHESVRLTEGQLEALLNTLDKRDWDFVQSVWDYVDGFKKESFDTAERMTGVRPKAVEAQAFTNAHGSYRGGYYPISYDPAKSRGAQLDTESALDQFMSAGRGAAAKVADGFTKQRAASGGGRALNYDFSVMMKHTRDTTRLIALGEPVQNARRILGHGLVAHTFREAGAQNLMSTLDLFLHDVASGPVYNNDPINGLSRIIKNNFTLSRLAFNLKTVALQVTGLGQSAAVIGKMNLLKGFADMRRRPDQVAREVMDKSSFMAERQTTFQKDVYDAANELRQASPIEGKWRKAKNVISAAGFTPMIKVQFYVVDLPTWLGAYRAEIERNGGDEDGAIHFADRMVDRSQGGGFMTDRNALERGTLSRNVRQADFVRLWTTLGGYMVTKLNRGYLTARGGARGIAEADTMAGRTGAAINMATDMTLLYMFEAAFMGLAYALLSEGEDDEDIRNFMIKEVTGAAIGGVPFVRESVGAFNGYGAGGVLSSALEIPANIWTQVSQGENDKAFRRSVADAAGIMTGLPTTQSMRIIEELIEGEDGSIAEAVIGRNPLDY